MSLQNALVLVNELLIIFQIETQQNETAITNNIQLSFAQRILQPISTYPSSFQSSQNVIQRIDLALADYYVALGRSDYYNANGVGKFIALFNEHNLDPSQIYLEFEGDIDIIRADCPFIKIDDNFPLNKEYKNINERNKEMFRIIKHCYKYGTSPSTIHHHPYKPCQSVEDACTQKNRIVAALKHYSSLNLNDISDKRQLVKFYRDMYGITSLLVDYIHILTDHYSQSDLDEIPVFKLLSTAYHMNEDTMDTDHSNEFIFYRDLSNLIYHQLDVEWIYEQNVVEEQILDIKSNKTQHDDIKVSCDSDKCESFPNGCDHTNRMRNALQYYANIDVVNSKNDQDDFENFCSMQLLNDHIHIVTEHNNELHKVYELPPIVPCNIENCPLLIRHYRNRRNDQFDDIKKDEEKEKLLFFRDLMDSMHCYLIHSYDIGMRIEMKHNDCIDDEERDKYKLKYVDAEFVYICKRIREKQDKLKTINGFMSSLEIIR